MKNVISRRLLYIQTAPSRNIFDMADACGAYYCWVTYRYIMGTEIIFTFPQEQKLY